MCWGLRWQSWHRVFLGFVPSRTPLPFPREAAVLPELGTATETQGRVYSLQKGIQSPPGLTHPQPTALPGAGVAEAAPCPGCLAHLSSRSSPSAGPGRAGTSLPAGTSEAFEDQNHPQLPLQPKGLLGPCLGHSPKAALSVPSASSWDGEYLCKIFVQHVAVMTPKKSENPTSQ